MRNLIKQLKEALKKEEITLEQEREIIRKSIRRDAQRRLHNAFWFSALFD
jgi:FKBP-type peptidyl-prolyl cis-trans isomerase (trigger factor)